MSRSWEVSISSVDSLKHAEYRFGDYAERTGRKLLGVVKTGVGALPGHRSQQAPGGNSPTAAPSEGSAGQGSGSEDGDLEAPDGSFGPADASESGKQGKSSKMLGNVTVELQVGSVKKRLRPFKVSGQVSMQVNDTMLLPEPPEGESMVVRVLRVGHMQEDSLIGECEVAEASGAAVRLPLYRKTGKGKEKGFVSLTVSLVNADCKPVSLDPNTPDAGTSSNPLGFLKDKRNRLVDKYMQVGTGIGSTPLGALTPGLPVHMRQPLLERPQDAPVVGECVVAIEGVRELSARASRPYFVMRLDGQEIRTDPEQLAHACEADLTYRFLFSSLQKSLCVYCYDDHGQRRNAAIGRVIIPLAGVPWGVGETPRFELLKKAVNPKASTYTQRLDAQFMPLSAAGDGQNDPTFVDRFQPARKRKDGRGVPGTGMNKKQAFGLLSLRLELNLEPSMRPPVKCYLKSITSQLKGLMPQGEQEQEQPPQNLDLMGVMQSKVVQQAVRNCERLEGLMKAPSRGFLRWVRAKPWHGPAAGLSWFAFCCTGLFPPPAWALPLYIWAMFLLNGIFVAVQRERDWSKTRDEAFPVWNEELEMSTPSLSELMTAFTKGIRTLERSTRVVLGTMERLNNLFTFADGVATVLFAAGLGLVAFGLSAVIYLWNRFDPTGAWFFGLAGLAACFALSTPSRRQAAQGGNKDPLARLEKLNRAFECVPDSDEVAHRYIASRVQCAPQNIPLKVSIVSASGLRNADHLPGQGLSDPYCTCSIPGKSKSKLCTQVINDNLNPVWNHEEVLAGFSVGDSLLFKVFDKDPGMTDDFLGKAKLASSQFYPRGFRGELELQEAGKGITAKLIVGVEVLSERPGLSSSGPSSQPLRSVVDL